MKRKETLEMRLLTVSDLDDVYELIQEVGREVNNDTFAYSEDKGIYERILRNSTCAGVFDKGRLVASFLTYEENEDIEGVYEAAGLSEKEIPKTLILETCQVLSEYRGMGLQFELGKFILRMVESKYNTVIATVHPGNYASIKSLLNLGLRKVDDVELYGGKKRMIMKKRVVHKESVSYMQKSKTYEMYTMYCLLCLGINAGISMMMGEGFLKTLLLVLIILCSLSSVWFYYKSCMYYFLSLKEHRG